MKPSGKRHRKPRSFDTVLVLLEAGFLISQGNEVMESKPERKSRVKKIIQVLSKTHPDAKQALEFHNPLELLVALILAAQARDDLVNSVTSQLFPKYRTAADWAAAAQDTLQAELQRINFYRKKGEAIQKACRALVERFGGDVPADHRCRYACRSAVAASWLDGANRSGQDRSGFGRNRPGEQCGQVLPSAAVSRP